MERGRLYPRGKVCSRKEANLTKLRLESLAAPGEVGREKSDPPPSIVVVHIRNLEGGLAEWPKVAEGGRVGSREMRNCLL